MKEWSVTPCPSDSEEQWPLKDETQSQPSKGLSLLPRDNFQATVQGDTTQVALGPLREWWRWSWGSGRHSQSCCRDKVSEKRERIPDVCKEPLHHPAQCRSAHACEESTQRWKGTVQKDLEVTVPGTHTELGSVPQSQIREPRDWQGVGWRT